MVFGEAGRVRVVGAAQKIQAAHTGLPAPGIDRASPLRRQCLSANASHTKAEEIRVPLKQLARRMIGAGHAISLTLVTELFPDRVSRLLHCAEVHPGPILTDDAESEQ